MTIPSLKQCLFWWTEPSENPVTYWDFWGSLRVRKFGNLKLHALAAAAYAVAALLPVVSFLWRNPEKGGLVDLMLPDFAHTHPSQLAGCDLVLFVVWAAFMTVALPLFQWFEACMFDEWFTKPWQPGNGTPDSQQKLWFETNARHVETFWKAVGERRQCATA